MSAPRPHPPDDLEPLDFFQEQKAEPFYELLPIVGLIVIAIGWLVYIIFLEWHR